MKVVVVVDSFKGSMTSMEAGMAVKAGILAAKKDAEVIVKPLAGGRSEYRSNCKTAGRRWRGNYGCADRRPEGRACGCDSYRSLL